MEHSFDVGYAIQYGVNEAIIIRHLQYYISRNRALGNNNHDGHWWTYTTIDSMSKVLPYMSIDKVRYAIDKLVSKGVLLKGSYSKKPMDRTIWYAFSDDDMFLNWEKSQMELGKIPNGIGKIPEAIPITITNTITNNKETINTHARENLRLILKGLSFRGQLFSERLEMEAYRNGVTATIEDFMDFYLNDPAHELMAQGNEKISIVQNVYKLIGTFISIKKNETIDTTNNEGEDGSERLSIDIPCSTD